MHDQLITCGFVTIFNPTCPRAINSRRRTRRFLFWRIQVVGVNVGLGHVVETVSSRGKSGYKFGPLGPRMSTCIHRP